MGSRMAHPTGWGHRGVALALVVLLLVGLAIVSSLGGCGDDAVVTEEFQIKLAVYEELIINDPALGYEPPSKDSICFVPGSAEEIREYQKRMSNITIRSAERAENRNFPDPGGFVDRETGEPGVYYNAVVTEINGEEARASFVYAGGPMCAAEYEVTVKNVDGKWIVIDKKRLWTA